MGKKGLRDDCSRGLEAPEAPALIPSGSVSSLTPWFF